MEKISPDEILQKHGNWIERQKFIELVARNRNVGERQAWNIIRKESHAKRLVYADRSTSYGLPQFGPPPPQIEKTLASGPTHFGLLGGVIEALNLRAERKVREKNEQSRRRKFEIALLSYTMWLGGQGFTDEKYESELEAAKSRLLAEYGLSHR